MAFDLSKSLNAIFNTASPPALGPGRRADALPLSELENDLESAVSQSGVSGDKADLVRSAALLWHDHLDASHTLSQDIRSNDGSFLHGIMHRREPDYPNAKYWFNRAGEHVAYRDISKNSQAILAGTPLAQLIEGSWDAFAMVDAVGRAKVDSKEYALLQQVQAIEVESILRPLFPD